MVQREVNQYLLLRPLILDTVLKSTTYIVVLDKYMCKQNGAAYIFSNGKLLVRCIVYTHQQQRKRRNWVIYSMLSISASPIQIQSRQNVAAPIDFLFFFFFFQSKTIIFIFGTWSSLRLDSVKLGLNYKLSALCSAQVVFYANFQSFS